MVRPKTHGRESSRGMLTLTEEEASRRSGGSPAHSPCHSLPSAGGPRRRESEPIGPHRQVRSSAGQSEESLVPGAGDPGGVLEVSYWGAVWCRENLLARWGKDLGQSRSGTNSVEWFWLVRLDSRVSWG